MKYRTEGITNNKKIKSERKKPIPLRLMRDDIERDKSRRRDVQEDNDISKDV